MNPILRCLLYLLLALPAAAWAQTNDGFLRRDGTMYLVRNGQPRPMPHDVHLPNGRTVTHDGFVVEADGRRTELREGSGCNLNGNSVAATTQAGRIALVPVASRTASPSSVQLQTLVSVARARWAGGRGKGHYKKRKHKKHDD